MAGRKGDEVIDERCGSMSSERRNATSRPALTPPLKWHLDGGKHYLARRIRSLFPPVKSAEHPDGYLHYVEPFAGGLAVLLASDGEGVSEVVNDLDCELTNFWIVLRSAEMFGEFRRLVEATPFSEPEWRYQCQWAYLHPAANIDPVRRALAFFITCRQSLAGRMAGFTGVTKTRTRRGMNNEVSAWLTAVEGLPAVHARLQRVLVLNRPALDVIRGQDGPATLFYLDPPYLHETRRTTSEYGQYEMTDADHQELLHILTTIKGKFVLSGYHSALYDAVASSWDWHCTEVAVPNHAAGGKAKRTMTECLWSNFAPSSQVSPASATNLPPEEAPP